MKAIVYAIVKSSMPVWYGSEVLSKSQSVRRYNWERGQYRESYNGYHSSKFYADMILEYNAVKGFS